MAATVAGSVPHSVFPVGDLGKHAPNYGELGKHTVSVDVVRLQAELRALHQRIEYLELVRVTEAEERAKEEEDLDKSSGSSGLGAAGVGCRAARGDDLSVADTADTLTVDTQGDPSHRYTCVRTYW